VVTEYGLTNSDQTLLVVNMHVVNFTFGIHDFREQIQQALSVLTNHTGPVLLSGDFNTWHRRRAAILKEMTAEQNLRMVDFDEDHRKRFLGQPLDHVYIRGLEVLEATTRTVDSSDHNPMSVRLRTMSRQSPTMVAD
jgi:endonuclease/exonuclease/phosphatase (EEP) superfamily protein YafD